MPDSSVDEKKATLRRKILGVKIRHARTRAGLNLKEVGQALGLAENIIAELEYGQRDVSLPQLEALALIFNVPVIYFWSDEIIAEPNLEFPTRQAMDLRRRIIGVLVRQGRTEAGLTQAEIAKALSISEETVAAYEFGQVDIPLPQLETLSELLQKPIAYFLDKGISQNGSGPMATLDDIANYSQLSTEVKEFLSNPANVLYINIAMKLSEMSAETLRALAEGLLEVTY